MTEEELRRSPLFADLPPETLRDLLACGEEVRLAHGTVLFEEGDPADAMYIVRQGELGITKRAGDADVTVNVLGPGELVGELGLIHRRPRNATVAARTDATVLRIGADALDRLLAHPESARALLTSLTGRLDRQELILRHHDRMAGLGMLTAGLLHELNNPAAAIQRSIGQLRSTLEAWQEADRALGDPDVADRLWDVVSSAAGPPASPIARADAEDALRARLETLGIDRPWEVAGVLVGLGLSGDDIDRLTGDLPDGARSAALRWLASRGRVRRLVDEAATAATRISDIVTSVKSFSHETATPATDVDVHAGLEQALTLLRHKLPHTIEVVRDYDPAVPAIQGYPGDLVTVWTNLVANAADAMGDTGTLTVRTRAADDTVRVEIANTGEPIPEDVLERVFDPFFTTKPIGQGTGLGLSTTFAIVTQRHHGQLALAPTSEGTVATVELPTSLPAGA